MKVTYKELVEMAKKYKNVSVRYIDEEDGEIIVNGFTEERTISNYKVEAIVNENWYQNNVRIEISTNLNKIVYTDSVFKGNSGKLCIPDFVWEIVEKIIKNYNTIIDDRAKTKFIVCGEVFMSMLDLMKRNDNGKLLRNENIRLLHKGEVIYIGEYCDPYGEEYSIEYFNSREETEKHEAFTFSTGMPMELCRIRKVEG